MDLDDSLIEHLRRKRRASITELAAATFCSRRTVQTRLDALLETGAIRIVAAVHPGYRGITAYAHLVICVSGRVRPVLDAVVAVDGIAFVSAVTGEYQIVTEVRESDQHTLADTIATVRALPGVASINVLTYVEVLRGTLMPRIPVSPERRVDAIDEL